MVRMVVVDRQNDSPWKCCLRRISRNLWDLSVHRQSAVQGCPGSHLIDVDNNGVRGVSKSVKVEVGVGGKVCVWSDNQREGEDKVKMS